MPLRLFPLSLLSGGVTFALFWIMTALIATPDVILPPPPAPKLTPWVNVRTPDPPLPRPDPRPQKPEIEPLPEPVPLEPTGAGEGPLVVGPAGPTIDPFAGDEGFQLVRPSGDAVPLVRVPPRYPARALARGLEGRVLVEFTVDPAGRVRDAFVVAAEPPNVFDEAALEAVKQWRYEPRIEDGRPVSRRGLKISLPFVVGADAR